MIITLHKTRWTFPELFFCNLQGLLKHWSFVRGFVCHKSAANVWMWPQQGRFVSMNSAKLQRSEIFRASRQVGAEKSPFWASTESTVNLSDNSGVTQISKKNLNKHNLYSDNLWFYHGMTFYEKKAHVWCVGWPPGLLNLLRNGSKFDRVCSKCGFRTWVRDFSRCFSYLIILGKL